MTTAETGGVVSGSTCKFLVLGLKPILGGMLRAVWRGGLSFVHGSRADAQV